MAPSGSFLILRPALLTVPPAPHSLPQQAKRLGIHAIWTYGKQSLGAGHASPSSASGPVFSLLGQDFFCYCYLGFFGWTSSSLLDLSARLGPLPLLGVMSSGRQKWGMGIARVST